jgi:small subunit ribosomal protein S19
MFFKKMLKQNDPLIKQKKAVRAGRILPSMLGQSFRIHNGRKFKRFSVVRSHVGFKFGEFYFTRRTINHKTRRKKK